MSLGVIGYLAARLAAETHGTVRVRRLSRDERDGAALVPDQAWVWPLTLTLADQTAVAHVVLPTTTATWLTKALVRDPFARAGRIAALGALPLSVCAHGGQVVLRASELLSLQRGDVVFPEQIGLSPCAGGYQGEISLHVAGNAQAPLARSTLRIDTLTLTRLSIEDALETGEPMTEGKNAGNPQPSSQLEPLGDAPIELCLELARFSLRLDELLALREGELLSTGKPVGSEVTLSAAGRPVARGELVVIEGEVGVRITTLLKP
jgi:type III secretion system YscQ/HrcQ family protein